MSCAYDEIVTNEVEAYLDSGHQVFWKVYLIGWSKMYPPYRFFAERSSVPVVMHHGFIISNRFKKDLEDVRTSSHGIINRGIHVFVDKSAAAAAIKLLTTGPSGLPFIIVPVFAHKENFVGAGFNKLGVISRMPKKSAVFMKIQLEKRALLNVLIENMGRSDGRRIREIMASVLNDGTVAKVEKTPELELVEA